MRVYSSSVGDEIHVYEKWSGGGNSTKNRVNLPSKGHACAPQSQNLTRRFRGGIRTDTLDDLHDDNNQKRKFGN